MIGPVDRCLLLSVVQGGLRTSIEKCHPTVVAVVGLFLFLLDGALVWAVDSITGVKG